MQFISCLTYGAILFFVVEVKAVEVNKEGLDHATTTISPSTNYNKMSLQRQKRQETEPFYPDYTGVVDFNDYPGPNPNYLVPASIAGGTGLALKAVKAKAKLKGLKLLAVPAGIALLGGIAALASGIIPPAVIGGINLPFQGKRRKRNVHEDLKFKIHLLNNKNFLTKPQIHGKTFQIRT